jgi:peptide/nickel transport system substrate-binding protein
VAASTQAEKKATAEAVQKHAMEVVTHIPLGEWVGVWAVRSNVDVPAKPAPVTVFWGMSKK